MIFPTIETKRMLLRELNKDDNEILFELFSNPMAMKYWDTPPHESIKTTTEALVKMNKSFQDKQGMSWGIISKKTNKLIGYFGLHSWNLSKSQSKLGYIISPSNWGEGLGAEVLNSIVNFCFNEMHFESVLAEVDPNNQSSIVILEKNDFVLIEEKKKDLKINNNYYDTNIYECTNAIA